MKETNLSFNLHELAAIIIGSVLFKMYLEGDIELNADESTYDESDISSLYLVRQVQACTTNLQIESLGEAVKINDNLLNRLTRANISTFH